VAPFLKPANSEEDPFAELEQDLAKVIPDPAKRELFLGVFRGFASMKDTAGGRALMQFIKSTPPEEIARLKTPEFAAEYRERQARFYEEASDAELLAMARAIGCGPTFSKKDLASLVGRPARNRTAKRIRDHEMEGVPPGREIARKLRGTPLPLLTAAEQAQMARALRFVMPRFVAAEDEARGGNLAGAVELLAEGTFSAPALMLKPPPHGEPYGRKNRSEILLPSDRKHCAAPNCDKIIPNRATYCRLHARSAIQERDTQKKGKIAAARKLRRTTEAAVRAGGLNGGPNAGDTLPEEFAPINRRRRAPP
jgi:hypothetical protein